MQIVAAGREAAVDAVRRALFEAASASSPALPVTAVTAVAPEHGSLEHSQTPSNRFAGRVVPAIVLERTDSEGGIVDVAGERLRVSAGLPPAGASVLLRFSAPAAAAPAATAAAQITLGAIAQALSEVNRDPPSPLALGRVPAPVDQPARFARGLSDLVRDSGMFYESHVARWAQDRYPLEQLLREPQAVPEARESLPAVPPGAPPAPGLPSAAAPLAESGQPIVREQLGLLENRSAAFAFQPWPGQEARLVIADEREHQAASGVPVADACWTSTLSLDLPRLGRIDVVLTLRGRQLQIAFAASDTTQARMSADSPELRAAMADAGIALTSFSLRQDSHA